MIVENDVRLMRRYLVARQGNDVLSQARIVEYLRDVQDLEFILPDEQEAVIRTRFVRRLSAGEQYLVAKYGCILLPNYDGKGHDDIIFLNSKWVNPRTLYVRLVEPTPALGVLGSKFWLPFAFAKDWSELAVLNHEAYLLHTRPPEPEVEPEPETLWQKVKRWLGRN